jgi:hypothetical protein
MVPLLAVSEKTFVLPSILGLSSGGICSCCVCVLRGMKSGCRPATGSIVVGLVAWGEGVWLEAARATVLGLVVAVLVACRIAAAHAAALSATTQLERIRSIGKFQRIDH